MRQQCPNQNSSLGAKLQACLLGLEFIDNPGSEAKLSPTRSLTTSECRFFWSTRGLLMRTLLLLAATAVSTPALAARCNYDPATLSFRGNPVDQARCLLRPVAQWAHLGPELEELPNFLSLTVGRPMSVTPLQLRGYLETSEILEADLGGDFDEPLSAATRAGKSFPAQYFVIHDTSSPNYELQPFPDFDSPDWPHNQLRQHQKGNASKAHVFVNRLGESKTAVEFDTPWRSTKFELKYRELYPAEDATAARGRFLHIELIQPRRSAKAAGLDDAVAPKPGFTDGQYERLALLYVVASVRAGHWLIPVYHAVLDAGMQDAHDDPQNFSLGSFSAFVDIVYSDLLTQFPGLPRVIEDRPD